jgi:trimethylamine:corrinoid methyltransferase-like protein
MNLEGNQELDIRQRARARLDSILAEHEPQPLEEAVQNEITLILKKAAEHLGM